MELLAEHDPKFLIPGQRLQDFINLVPRAFTQARVKVLGTRLGFHRTKGGRLGRPKISFTRQYYIVPASSPWVSEDPQSLACERKRISGCHLLSSPWLFSHLLARGALAAKR